MFYASCFASDGTGHIGMCSYLIDGAQPSVLLAFQSVNSDSDVSFTWDVHNNCTSIYVNNASYYDPKKP